MGEKEINKHSNFREFSKGIIAENPVFVLLLGLCPFLAVTSSLANGLGMGIAATFVLLCSNILVSLLKDFIPEKVRIPAYIVIIASFVTIVKMLLEAFLPALASSLGVFVPLIVVNCIILGRAEAFANKNNVLNSVLDALGNGLGFTFALSLVGIIREILGTAAIDLSMYGIPKLNLFFSDNGVISAGNTEIYSGAAIFIMPAGAFFVVGVLLAAIHTLKSKFSKDK